MIAGLTKRSFLSGAGLTLCCSKPAMVRAVEPATGPLRFGLLLDLSSAYSENSGQGCATAVRMAMEDFGGTVLGRPLDLLAADHQNKADIASTQARKWFDEDGVQAILEVIGTGPTVAAIAAAKDHNRIVISNGAGSSSLTDEDCTPTFVQYTWTTRSVARTIGKALVERGASSWFFITVDYTFGHQFEADTAAVVRAAGGMVLGSVKAPLGTTDYSSYLLQAQASGAKAVGFAMAGGDTVNALKQAHEFGLPQQGQQMAALTITVNDVHALGLDIAQGTLLAAPFYWNLSDETRAFGQRFFKQRQRMPNFIQAGDYSSTLTYLNAVQAAGTIDAQPVMVELRRARIDDMFATGGHIRKSGLMVHDMHLFKVKAPGESKGPWDFYDLIATISGTDAYGPESESKCRLPG
jgi:branched-chain amino acid transport system substrate-binding protein